MSFLNNLGSSLQRVEFVQSALKASHQFIDEHQLDVKKEDADLNLQMHYLEKWSGTAVYAQGLGILRFWNRLSLLVLIFILALFAGIYVSNLLLPAQEIFKSVLSWLFNNMVLGCGFLLLLFALLLITVRMTSLYGNKLYGGIIYQSAWQNFYKKVEG